MIKSIILDYGGVLAYPISGNWFIPYNLFGITGKLNALKLFFKRNKLNKAFLKGNEHLKSNHKLFTEEEEHRQFIQFYKIVFAEMKINLDDNKLGKIAREIVYDDYKVKFYDDSTDGIKELKTKYKVMILSDTWPSTKRVLQNQGIFPLLDGLIMSCNYNETKETTKLFEIAIQEYGLIPGECVFIDDSPANLKNSEKAGFIPVLMDRDGTVEKSEYPVIRQLNEINGIIENGK
jgi:putative hydrolase of the HAD superfamily